MNLWVWWHIASSVLSYIAFMLAGVSGALFLVQERQLKQVRMGRLFHWIPSLAGLDRLNLWTIAWGFALFTVSLLCGIAGQQLTLGRGMRDPGEALAYVMWGLYAGLLALRWMSTLRGRKVAILSVLGFGMALFTFIGVHAWLPAWRAVL